MVVDYFHFIVVSGPEAAVRDFCNRISLVATRRVAGVTRRTTVPFSFESLYAVARLRGPLPYDGYDMARWPIARRGRDAEVRYRLHTRGLEMHPLLKPLSRAVPRLSFALASLCLDDGAFGAFTAHAGKLRGRWLGADWREPFWERAASEFNMTLEDVYDDPSVASVAESWMLDEAVRLATGSPRRYDWNGGRTYDDLDDERERAIRTLTEALKQVEE